LFGFFASEDTGGNPILTVIGFGMILMISKVPEFVKSAFGVEDKAGKMVAQSVVGGMATPVKVQAAYKQWQSQRQSQQYQKEMLKNARRQRYS